MTVAGLEGIDASSMDVIDALGAVRYAYDEADRIVRPVLKHADFAPVAVNRDGERVIDRVRFGMPSFQGRLITNARSEKVTEARTWKALFGKRDHHCVTAISYVVERDAKKQNTYRIQRRDGQLLVVPGLCAVRHYSFSSTGNEYDDLGHVQLTIDANDFVASVHDRFVCELVTPEAREAWMAPDAHTQGELLALLQAAPNEAYEMVPISPDIWKRKDDPTAAVAVGEPLVWTGKVQGGKQQTLF